MQKNPCITLIGMPGAGKSTIGRLLASRLNYAFMDTDYLIEALYGRRLQDVTESLTREQFLDAECETICAIQAHDCVIATGGSVIYRNKAMEHLAKLGIIIHLDTPLEALIERIALNPERGISAGPGQSLAELYKERMNLYKQYALASYDTGCYCAEDCCAQIIAGLNQI